MTFRLTKHHGLGNDFLVHLTDDAPAVQNRAAWIERAQRWCRRHHGIGADGLLIGLHGTGRADLVMTLINADGSIAEMSGNGIRCLAQAEAMRRNQERGTLVIETGGGLRTVEYTATNTGARHQGTIEASVDMGPARPGPAADRPTDAAGDARSLGLDALKAATFDLGNPHLVLLVDDPEAIDLAVAGATHEAAYDAGMNVHFVAPTPGEADAITMRVWERGAGVTEACGTGATAVARAAHDWGLTGDQVTVHMPGGDVQVLVGDPMVLRGPSTFIAGIVVTA
ncbi:diaminopimelate epimerase [Aquihabitans sp. McL0605]|uniref:diaminopimelate epimerase n=1 Tax=Aquihabitans sp. McL0605 TaxID=3415671 RepID=UPI003CEAEEB9